MGRPKNIKSPAEMWQHFEAYRKETKAKPKKRHDYVGGMGKSVHRKLERPLTMEGYQNYLEDKGIITDVTDYFENKEGRYSDFVRICTRVRREIRQDQIEGGMVGNYNASITQRLNNLSDKIEQTNIEQPLFPDETK